MRKKKCRIILLCLVTVLLIVILSCYLLVSANAKGKTFNDIQGIPFNEVGLLLGTSPVTSNGEHNYYFDERVKATAALYHSGKIKRIIASGGDYSSNGGCNELIAMRDSLIKQEVPDSLISLDYQGTRTPHSIAKVKDLGSITIIHRSTTMKEPHILQNIMVYKLWLTMPQCQTLQRRRYGTFQGNFLQG